MAPPDAASEQIVELLEWLKGDPADDCVADLDALLGRLPRLLELAAGTQEFAGCLQQFDERVFDVAERLKARLLEAELPLSAELRGAAGRLVELLQEVGGVFALLGEHRDLRTLLAKARRHELSLLLARALALMGDAYLVSCVAAMGDPPRLWHRVYAMLPHLDDGEGGADSDALPEAAAVSPAAQFNRLAALAVLEPASLTARELVWAFEYLGAHSGGMELSRRPLQPEGAVFWIDPASDGPPVARNRRAPPRGLEVINFSAMALCRRLGEQIESLERRIADAEALGLERETDLQDPGESGLPLGLTPLETLSLLQRMRERWSTPPSREHPRRPNQYTVQVCQGLRPIWNMLRGEGGGLGHVSRWVVFNESPGGYAIMNVSGVAGVLSAGMVLALRRSDNERWSICIVRWIRTEDAARVELGLQVVAHGCTPISIGFRGSERSATTAALVLPPLHGVRRNTAILAPAGTYKSRRFLIVREGRHLYVAQGRVLSLDMQTANVELFQYEIDTYPI